MVDKTEIKIIIVCNDKITGTFNWPLASNKLQHSELILALFYLLFNNVRFIELLFQLFAWMVLITNIRFLKTDLADAGHIVYFCTIVKTKIYSNLIISLLIKTQCWAFGPNLP